ncbi:MAG: 1-acyl-sn-glycerol-3-phosphate acyltransferase [Myxococcota bacterium]|nr:1-acyl-sn-glycerol-3-phosphate acyltransferase [Myxococcota bacterium]
MLREPPWWWRRLSRTLVRSLSFEARRVEDLKQAAEEGQIIYVIRARSRIDYLVFNQLFLQYNLPLARFANGVRLSHMRGFRAWILSFFQRDTLPEEALSRHLSHGDAALLFLRARRLVGVRRTSPAFMEKVVSFQRETERPIFLVPLFLRWPPAPPSRSQGLWDILFGDSQDSGSLRKLLHFLRYAKQASVRLGNPINLQDALQLPTHRGWSDARIARKYRRLLLIHLNREALSVHGPAVKANLQLKHEILERRAFVEQLKNYAQQQQLPLESVQYRARRQLNEIAATPTYRIQLLFARFLDILFNRVFQGAEIDDADIQRVKDAAKMSRSAPLVLIPSHKSHVDYLVISWLFLRNDFICPYIAAGANLSFWPLGPLLRRSGAFFLRRSFVGAPLYKQVFKQYLWKLVREGYPLEFFIEGGRSRTGKLLQPKLGILSMLLEGYRLGEFKDLTFVPINLSYERVVETAAYRKELTGGEKRSESVGEVMKARKVFQSRYGRIYICIEEPIRLSDYLKQNGLQDLKSDESFRRESNRLAFQILYRIQLATVVAPSALVAMVLLSHEQRGLSDDALKARVGLLAGLLEEKGVRLSRSLRSALKLAAEPISLAKKRSQTEAHSVRGQALTRLIEESMGLLKRLVQRLERGDRVVYKVPPERRIELDYYRNAILSSLAPEAILCLALESRGGSLSDEQLHDEARWLSRLLKIEFIYQNDKPFRALLGELLETLMGQGILERREGGGWRIRNSAWGALLAGSIRHLLESYWVAALSLHRLFGAEEEGKSWIKAAHEQAELELLEGELRREEAASIVTLTNALRWFTQAGWLQQEVREEGRKRYSYYRFNSSQSQDRVELLERLSFYLGHQEVDRAWRPALAELLEATPPPEDLEEGEALEHPAEDPTTLPSERPSYESQGGAGEKPLLVNEDGRAKQSSVILPQRSRSALSSPTLPPSAPPHVELDETAAGGDG